jgi:hypothetical protein
MVVMDWKGGKFDSHNDRSMTLADAGDAGFRDL